MFERHWNEAQQYTFTAALDSGGWAWEFLRRNPEYRRDWSWFRDTWERLEARYGKPPERDFVSWQGDPEAWRMAESAADDCAAEPERLLIECWMGEKWGFYKFPLDPATDRPQPGIQLHWREVEQLIPVVDDAASSYLKDDDTRIALGFDLDMPLRGQLERAKRLLQARQGRLRREGIIELQTVAGCCAEWTLMLRILDGIDRGASPDAIAALLGMEQPQPVAAAQVMALHAQARELTAGGYRRLLLLPA
ncbi:MAG: DUF6499 domain-containing protein [Thiogranum sp.]|nr:DUF6499 domain-containing protein [Thiogranum sp.]